MINLMQTKRPQVVARELIPEVSEFQPEAPVVLDRKVLLVAKIENNATWLVTTVIKLTCCSMIATHLICYSEY